MTLSDQTFKIISTIAAFSNNYIYQALADKLEIIRGLSFQLL